MTQLITGRMYNVLMTIPLFYRFTNQFSVETNALKIIHSFSQKAVSLRRQQGEPINPKDEMYLDVLLKSTIDGRPLDDNDLREEIDTLIFAVRK